MAAYGESGTQFADHDKGQPDFLGVLNGLDH
jgi:hypothetical protein